MLSNNISEKIGKIVRNLQSIEFALRLFLDETQGHSSDKRTYELHKLKVTDWVPVDYLTNYDTLKQLIEKTNKELKKRGLLEHIDETLVQLRDAIAHGRVFSLHPEVPQQLVKFSKPNNDKTQVTISVEMTQKWLSQQVKQTHDEILKIVNLGQSMGLECFPQS